MGKSNTRPTEGNAEYHQTYYETHKEKVLDQQRAYHERKKRKTPYPPKWVDFTLALPCRINDIEGKLFLRDVLLCKWEKHFKDKGIPTRIVKRGKKRVLQYQPRPDMLEKYVSPY